MPIEIFKNKIHITVVVLCVLSLTAAADETVLKIAYMKHPIQEASIDILDKWAAQNGVRFIRVPMAYEVFHEKVTAALTSGDKQFDIIWHNDDWGQLWKKWLETTGDVAGMDKVDRAPVDIAFLNDDGEPTVVPMVHTLGLLMYRTDLIAVDELPQTWEELIAVSQRLQAAGKVKWGFVGGMTMNHTWFTWLWSAWANNCDIFYPPYERNPEKLAENGWTPMLDRTCQQQVVEFWWDAINTNRISPKGMPSYSRNDANAIFQAGEAAFTVADTTMYGQFNNKRKSRVAGKVGIAGFPLGPLRKTPVAWNSIWGWAIPKGIPQTHKLLVKRALGAMLLDQQGQIELWRKTGGPPPNRELWDILAADDPVMAAIKRYALDLDGVVAGAFYMPQWPAIHKAYNDGLIEAVIGAREDIPTVLRAAAQRVQAAALH